jgi:very-short-patch-repair endonuclease
LFLLLTSNSHRATWGSIEIAKENQFPHSVIQSSKSYFLRLGVVSASLVLPLLADAKVLYNHLKNGGKLGFPGLRPKAVKIGWYILKEIRVDGKLCDNAETIDELIKCITANERISKHLIIVETQMGGNIHNHPSRAIIVSELEKISSELNTILNTKILLDQLASEVPSISDSNINTDNIHDNLDYYNELIDSIFAYKQLLTEEDIVNQLNEPLLKIVNDKEAHDINQKIIEVIKNRDIKKYHNIFEKLQELSTNLLKYKRFKELHNRLDPQIANILNSTGIDTDFKLWEQRLNHFEDSWRWAQANNWFHQFSNKDEKELKTEYSYLEKKIMQKITKLSSLKAWEECLNKLTETERQHLISWTYSMRKIGKDTGKNAYKHKKSAMEHMSYCRSAIPAWIMPLYRVVESFEPEKELFDVVIIDEASQSGPESIFLMYMAKQVIVVGDDMQISPENIGIPRDDVDYLRQKYIPDLPHSDQFGVDNSFFDLANILFGGRIILREHFRCMPEIIQFSNNLSYQNTPLIPLRQYPPNRLNPVNAIHVSEGYREGRGQSVKNVPEAEAIVKKMVECIADPIYKDKSFGVISLQGNLQAKIIENFLLKDIGPEEMERRNIICGDAYAFQGDERDVIFLSLVAADGETSMRALTSAKDRRRFNVAASRAKDQLWLFHTPTLNDFRNKECLRYQIVSYCQNPAVQPTSGARSDCESEFEKAVYDKIVQRGYRVIPQYEVAGYSIDLVVEGIEGRIAVECDGDFWHGPEKYASDMSRQRTLERSGWTFWRVRGSEFYYNPGKALESLWELLTQHNIKTEVLNRIDEELVIKQENKDNGLTANELETVSITSSLVNNTPKEVIKPILADQLNLFGNQLKIDDYLSLPEEEKKENTAVPLSINYTKVKPREPNKLPQLKSINLVEVLNNKGLEVLDKRKSKGSLWVIGGAELTLMFKELEEKGYEFVFTKKGGRTTKRRSGWYLK